jgi:hypothetical protein
MIVTVFAVGVMQMAIHQIIDVISVRYCLVAAVGPMAMRFIMSVALVLGSTSLRIGRVHLQAMIVHVIAV